MHRLRGGGWDSCGGKGRGELGARVDVRLAEGAGQVDLARPGCDEQPLGDLPVGLALARQPAMRRSPASQPSKGPGSGAGRPPVPRIIVDRPVPRPCRVQLDGKGGLDKAAESELRLKQGKGGARTGQEGASPAARQLSAGGDQLLNLGCAAASALVPGQPDGHSRGR